MSFGADKPMDVFGGKWENYTEKLYENWQKTVSRDDLVIIPGDVSWATYIEETYADFKFINELNGNKVIIKGNHDYWWTTLRKMEKFLAENKFSTIKIIHNTAIGYEDTAICGTRGWSMQECGNAEESEKILSRERQRLILSLEAARKLKKDRIIVGMHYPPADKNNPKSCFTEIMRNYGVDCCVYGHLHSFAHANAAEGVCDGVNLKLVAGDYVNFTPILV